MAQLADLLGKHFNVYNYDRRGRGDSGDTQPFAKEREIEDLQALIEDAGGNAMVFGISSGSAVALDTAAVTPGITKLAVYEAPFVVDGSRPGVGADYVEHLSKLVADGKRDEAVEYFLVKAVGIPAEYAAGAKQDPSWPSLLAVAHTIAYDGAFVADVMQGKPLPTDRWVKITIPTLVIDGGASEAWMQTHMVDPNVLAPVLIEFFKR
jgi:pimeloyl-ACP methyl ester carboxylesterase